MSTRKVDRNAEIVRMRDAGMMFKDIAAHYEVTPKVISAVYQRERQIAAFNKAMSAPLSKAGTPMTARPLSMSPAMRALADRAQVQPKMLSMSSKVWEFVHDAPRYGARG